MTDFVVMPNHVHVLVAFPDITSMLKQCTSWKMYSATQINRRMKRTGRFWQQDSFDHLVRSPEQFDFLRKYIRENPHKARLAANTYRHYSN
jgi:type I restriction enzyme R subunit